MKKTALLMVLFVALGTLASKAQNKFSSWPALGEFHKVMSETFHPSEKGDLKPVKERSAELAEKAAKLNSSMIPSEFNKPAVKKAVKLLAAESLDLDKLIRKKATDEQIKKSLVALHDRFHEIVGLCKDEGHEKH
eukprot:gene14733-17410_t